MADLEKLVEPTTRGHPERVALDLQQRAQAGRGSNRRGHRVSYPVVAELLHELGYSCKPTARPRKETLIRTAARETSMPSAALLALGQPVISVDTKKKEW